MKSFLPAVLASSAFALASVDAQTVIPSRIVQAIEFEDRGRLYRIDAGSGAVTYTESSDVNPIPPAPPKPNPKPDPPPKPPPAVVTKAAHVTLIVAAHNADHVRWMVDDGIRDAAERQGARFYAFRSFEEDVDELKFRKIATTHGIPVVIIQDDKGNVIFDRKAESVEDVIKAIELRK